MDGAVRQSAGGGDPRRTMELLWGTAEPPRRGPRPGLTVAQVVQAAIDVADGEGTAGLSMRRVADRLGVGAMTLYRYVPGRAELLDLMLDAVQGEVSRPPDVPGGWRARCEQVAREQLALYLRHPWLLQVATTRPVLGPHVLDKYEYELRTLEGLGLTDAEMDASVMLVDSFVQGAARGAVDAATTRRESRQSDTQWWHDRSPLLEKVLDVDRYPVASRVGGSVGEEQQAAYDPARAFEFGLGRLLDGLDVLVSSRRR